MKRYCLTLDLIDDPILIQEYEEIHKAVWPEIVASIRLAGITDMELYRLHNRLFMIMETDDSFTFENKKQIESQSEIVQKWESMLWKYQQPLTGSATGEKWILMERIFSLVEQ